MPRDRRIVEASLPAKGFKPGERHRQPPESCSAHAQPPPEACPNRTVETSNTMQGPESSLEDADTRTEEILRLAGELYTESRPASREECTAAYSALRRAGRTTRR